MKTTSQQGADAETLAADYLTRCGVRLIERNYRCRRGEIDLIGREGDTLLFIEVRLRTHSAYGGAGASIDARKRARIILAAQHYLAGQTPPPCRFDAILLSGANETAIEWIKDAFSA